MSRAQAIPQYRGYSYGEVTSDCDKQKGQYYPLHDKMLSDEIIIHNIVSPGITELGYAVNFRRDAEYSDAEKTILLSRLQDHFTRANAVLIGTPLALIKDGPANTKTLSFVFYSNVANKTAFERAIGSIEMAGCNNEFDLAPAQVAAVRADGRTWADASGGRQGHNRG